MFFLFSASVHLFYAVRDGLPGFPRFSQHEQSENVHQPYNDLHAERDRSGAPGARPARK